MSTINESIQRLLASGGNPIAYDLRVVLENRLGLNLGRVRIHLGAEASTTPSIECPRAYTVGRHVVFAEDEFRARERGGFRLLLHELTHAIQQDFADPHGASLALDPDPICEALADSAAKGMGSRSTCRDVSSRQPSKDTLASLARRRRNRVEASAGPSRNLVGG